MHMAYMEESRIKDGIPFPFLVSNLIDVSIEIFSVHQSG
jgi:hypothetical protein